MAWLELAMPHVDQQGRAASKGGRIRPMPRQELTGRFDRRRLMVLKRSHLLLLSMKEHFAQAGPMLETGQRRMSQEDPGGCLFRLGAGSLATSFSWIQGVAFRPFTR